MYVAARVYAGVKRSRLACPLAFRKPSVSHATAMLPEMGSDAVLTELERVEAAASCKENAHVKQFPLDYRGVIPCAGRREARVMLRQPSAVPCMGS